MNYVARSIKYHLVQDLKGGFYKSQVFVVVEKNKMKTVDRSFNAYKVTQGDPEDFRSNCITKLRIEVGTEIFCSNSDKNQCRVSEAYVVKNLCTEKGEVVEKKQTFSKLKASSGFKQFPYTAGQTVKPEEFYPLQIYEASGIHIYKHPGMHMYTPIRYSWWHEDYVENNFKRILKKL